MDVQCFSQKLPLGGFKLVEDRSHFKKSFIKSYKEDIDEGYFDEVLCLISRIIA